MFRDCFNAYLQCIERPKARLGANEEFIADFERVGLRTLKETFERQIFRLHFLSGADLATCLKRTGMPVRMFLRVVSRIEERLGEAFADLRPYPLWPVQSYFSRGRR